MFRDYMFWPSMAAQIQDTIAIYCSTYQTDSRQQPSTIFKQISWDYGFEHHTANPHYL